MICTVVSGVVTFAGLGLVASRYESETQLTITAKRSTAIVDAKNDASAAASITPRLDREAINTHVRALLAPDLLIKVAKELELERRPEFNAALGPVDSMDRFMRLIGLGGPHPDQTTEQRVLEALQASVTVSAARESRFLSIRAQSTSPDVAARITTKIAETYRQTLREIPVRETNEAVEALLPKIEQLREEVLQAEAAAKRFRAETNQLTGGSSDAATLEQQRLAALTSDLARAEADESRSEAKLRAAQDQSGRGAQSLAEVQQSKVIQDLIAERVRVERQVNEARAVLLPAHPRMRQLNADLAGIRRTIRAEIDNIVSGIQKELRVNRLRTARLREQIEALKQTAVANSSNEARLKGLEANARAKRNELDRLQKQLEDNRTVVETARVPVEATIVSRGRPSGEPVFPKKGPSTLLVMAATMMLGMALIIVKELMMPSKVPHNRRASDKRNVAREPMVGEIEAQPARAAAPTGTRRPGPSRRPAPAPAPAPAAPAVMMRARARHYHDQKPAEGGLRVLIAGADNQIDASDEAIELAHELSELSNRVVVVDWAPGGDPLLADIDVDLARPMSDLLTGEAEFQDIVVALADTNVHYIRASDGDADEDVFDEVGINLVLDALDEAYDQVIVVGRHDDAQLLFETIEGRFDAGLVVHQGDGDAPEARVGFLGFEVEDMDIIHHDRSARSVSAASPA
jgi:uncharacterized protein involved in exopolysaccharide biosynthesis